MTATKWRLLLGKIDVFVANLGWAYTIMFRLIRADALLWCYGSTYVMHEVAAQLASLSAILSLALTPVDTVRHDQLCFAMQSLRVLSARKAVYSRYCRPHKSQGYHMSRKNTLCVSGHCIGLLSYRITCPCALLHKKMHGHNQHLFVASGSCQHAVLSLRLTSCQ